MHKNKKTRYQVKCSVVVVLVVKLEYIFSAFYHFFRLLPFFPPFTLFSAFYPFFRLLPFFPLFRLLPFFPLFRLLPFFPLFRLLPFIPLFRLLPFFSLFRFRFSVSAFYPYPAYCQIKEKCKSQRIFQTTGLYNGIETRRLQRRSLRLPTRSKSTQTGHLYTTAQAGTDPRHFRM